MCLCKDNHINVELQSTYLWKTKQQATIDHVKYIFICCQLKSQRKKKGNFGEGILITKSLELKQTMELEYKCFIAIAGII